MAKQKTPGASRRPGSYPTNSLAQALNLGDVLNRCGGASGPVPKAVLAHKLGVGETAPGFYAVCATAKTFGVADGSRDLTLTDAGRDFFIPESPRVKRLAELHFFQNPDAFRVLIDRYDGNRLPDSTVLTNTLLRANAVPKSWAGRVASLFISTAEELALLDNGFLRFGAAIIAAKEEMGDAAGRDGAILANPTENGVRPDASTPSSQSPSQPDKHPTLGEPRTTRPGHRTWTYEDGSDVLRVELPVALNMDQWKLLNAYVQTRRPKEG